MNYRGSYRKLVSNAISAMLGAIEIYNKPRFAYRDEVVVVLVVNAWELLLKAIVSKSGHSIYYRKRRHEPYKTLTISDACSKALECEIWPLEVDGVAVELNLGLLVLYRNNVVHFYNEGDFGVILYSLLQTSIHNFRDVANIERYSGDLITSK
ncbi:DUF3644 domain-containing protein [Kibdelosporangium philippinense]|uniref:DUF3644 domain-containing protein n=1 Tax=Kibdelosporangium philippinense TaxID=211113 RepID=A0ABS8ZW56_9PSEU|nr:DUF3644 domain-containing protein [Kibdelosporangium philippinense]MCE7011503.1 DUF3644 domain-containing protein [Kibdelosporangium philippinense]